MLSPMDIGRRPAVPPKVSRGLSQSTNALQGRPLPSSTCGRPSANGSSRRFVAGLLVLTFAFVCAGAGPSFSASGPGGGPFGQVLPGPRAEDGSARAVRVGAELPATPSDLRVQYAHNSPQIVAHPRQPDMLAMAVRIDGPDFSCSLQISGNGGKGWIGAKPVLELPAGAERCYAPEVAFGPDGLLYYLFVGLHTAGNTPMGVFLTTSSDFGQTFRKPWKVFGPRHYMVRMAIDPDAGNRGRLHFVWLSAGSDPPLGGLGPPPNPILSAYSDDGGKTLSRPVRVSDSRRMLVVAPALTIGQDGAVHVMFYDLQDDLRDYQGLQGPAWEGNWELVISTSHDRGRSFGPAEVVDAGIVPPERILLVFTMAPASLVADHSGRLFAAWHDGRNGDWDVFLRRSDDGGRRWTKPLRLHDDRERNGRHQYLPRLSIAPNGRIDAIFYDRRNDPRNIRNHVFYTHSTDTGSSFSRNRKITRKSFSSAIGQRYRLPSETGLVEIGSRLGLFSLESRVVAAWTDTRNSAGGLAQDVFAATLSHPGEDDRSTPPGWIWAAGSAGFLAAVLVATLVLRRARRTSAAALLLLAAVSCRPNAQALPPAPQEVRVSMSEYRFNHPAQLSAGRTVFRFTNRGRLPHQATLLSLPANFPPIREQLAGSVRRPVPTVALVYALEPENEGAFAVDLAPGRYALVCYVEESPGVQHADKGMSGEFRVI